ncbi:DUF1737 domain-containing protein [Marinobacter lutaoensis]|uniref:DUF1737 domain-containing protein n=1 Tax=Marinobacter lutaoensis TaxID=135739 RepID=UPI001C3792D4
MRGCASRCRHRRRSVLPPRHRGPEQRRALYGEPSLTYDPARGTVICGQAIVRTIESTMYNKTLDLSVL